MHPTGIPRAKITTLRHETIKETYNRLPEKEKLRIDSLCLKLINFCPSITYDDALEIVGKTSLYLVERGWL